MDKFSQFLQTVGSDSIGGAKTWAGVVAAANTVGATSDAVFNDIRNVLAKVTSVMLSSATFENPFEITGISPMGLLDEILDVMPGESEDQTSTSDLFEESPADVAITLISTTFSKKISITYSEKFIRRFLSGTFEQGVALINGVVTKKLQGLDIDVYAAILDVSIKAATENLVQRVVVPNNQPATIATAIQAAIYRLIEPRFGNQSYSRIAGGRAFRAFCNKNDIRIVGNANTIADIDVNTLANMFGIERTDLGRLRIIASADYPADSVLVCSRDAIQNRTVLDRTGTFDDPSNLRTKVYRHMDRKIGLVPSQPAVLITTTAVPTIAPTGVVLGQAIKKPATGEPAITRNIALIPAGANAAAINIPTTTGVTAAFTPDGGLKVTVAANATAGNVTVRLDTGSIGTFAIIA